jgi:flagellar hook-associated protein 1
MTLGLSLDVARSSLATTGDQISLVSRNIARIDDPDASRKTGRVVTGPGSAVHISRVDRATDAALLDKFLTSNSDAKSQKEILVALNALDSIVGDTELARSPSALIGKLGASLQQLSAAPYSLATAASVVNAASDLASTLNSAAQAADSLRRQADTDIGASVDLINSLLQKFQEANQAIVQGTHRGSDVTDAMDARDGILKALSAEVGINTLSRSDGDIAIFTDSGITLFDKTPRSVTFQATPLLANGSSGSPVYADGVPIVGAQHSLGIQTGRLAGLMKVRDEIIPAYQKQLDETARGLISAFAETDQSASPTLPPAAGLFTYAGGSAVPPAGVIIPGLASMIEVNSNVDQARGGNPFLIRDGSISSPGNPAYTYNVSGSAAFTDRIQQMISAIDATQPFDSSAQLQASSSLTEFSTNSVSWLETLRQSAQSEADYRAVVTDRAQSSLAKVAGVSLDEEMTNMLELERTFQATSRLISAVDTMLQALMSSVR